MSGYLYLMNDLKGEIALIRLYNELLNLFTIKSNSFQRKHEFIATPFILQ